MDHKRRSFPARYKSEFQSTWSNPKHAFRQVNGETQQTQSLIILEQETRKRS